MRSNGSGAGVASGEGVASDAGVAIEASGSARRRALGSPLSSRVRSLCGSDTVVVRGSFGLG